MSTTTLAADGPAVEDHPADDTGARFRQLFEHAPVGMVECLTDGTIVHPNAAFCRMLGYRPEELVGLPAGRFLSDDSERRQQRADLRRLGSTDPHEARDYSARRVLRHKNGSLVPVHFWVVVVPGPPGEAPRLLKTCTDASHHVRVEERLGEADDELVRRQALTDAVLDSLDVGVVACDREGVVTLSNRAVRSWQERDLDEHDGDDGLSALPGRDPLLRALTEGSVTDAEVVIGPRGRAVTRVLCTGRSMVTDAGEVLGAVIAMTDITERRRAEDVLAHQARHDALTGLLNREAVLGELQALLDDGTSAPRTPVYALFCDLDGFKAANDQHGHAAGDHLLVEIARRLETTVRPADVVGRLGGDEFLLVCRGVRDLPEVRAIAARVEQVVAQPVCWRGHEIRVSVSIGIASGEDLEDAEELVRHADTAMYHAKRLGKDRSEMFDEALRARSSAHHGMEDVIRRALHDGCVEAHYQPVVDLEDGRIVGFEALARIRAVDGTLVMPGDFIPVAEESDLIVQLGTRMMTSACAQVARWREETGRPLSLAVNLSARQAARPDLDTVVFAVLTAANLPPAALHLELTESVLLEAASSTLRTLDHLRREGVQIGIDDFGTGYASLRYLRQLPATFLKVDREFVDRMTTSHDDHVIVRTVMGLAADLGLSCVVEGVETREQLALLSGRGAYGQGYLFGRPVEASVATTLLRQGRPAPPWA